MKDGVIADFEVTETMLNQFIGKVHENVYSHQHRVLWCVCHANQLWLNAVIREAVFNAGA